VMRERSCAKGAGRCQNKDRHRSDSHVETSCGKCQEL
jgi:hypothetical protein